MRLRRRRTGPLVLACLLAAVLAASACTGRGRGPGGGAGGHPRGPEQFTGTVEEFYDVPDPLPPGRPGDLIRVQQLDAPEGEAGLRIMYHSTDAEGDDRAVTGVVYYPTASPPRGGWPVLASAHGTTGIAPQCAPSRIPLVPNAYGVEGVRVATDYVGLGPVGEVHPYLDAAAEGNAVIDSVRAVDQLDDAHAGDEWLLVGHSQGGHAALVTSEMAERLRHHELLGTVAIAPGAQFTETYGDEVQLRIITTMVLFGQAAEDPEIDPAAYLNPDAYAAASRVVAEGCLPDIISTMIPYAVSPAFYVQDPQQEERSRTWMEENDPAQAAVDAPLLLISGDRDIIVVPARTHALYDRLCDLGQVVELVDLPDADHETEPAHAADLISAWLADRVAGEPATSTCA
jgi:pimeloyl-ACP methyl ester carboxylesterase